MATRLLTLASGRVPLVPRLLAWSTLSLLLGAWVVLDPGHQASPRLLPASPDTLLLPPRSPWVERAELADPASLFLRSPSPLAEVPVTAQPEATPFLAYGPDLRTQPGQPLSTLPAASPLSAPQPLSILLKPEPYPFRTLGQVSKPSPPPPRPPTSEVFSDSGELMMSVAITGTTQAKEIHKALSKNGINYSYATEFRFGIDAFGLQARPFLTRSSSDAAFDQAALEWVIVQPWASQLPPGSYRLRVGP